MNKRTWAEINLDVIKNYIKEVRKITSGDAMVMAVVKADGYGQRICGVVIGFICLKSYDLAVVIGGIAIGYVFLSELAIFGLRQLKFVRDVLVHTDMKTAVTIGFIISVLCAFTTLCLFKKCFNITYILSTAVIATVIAFVLPAIFIFKDAESATKSILAAGDIGMCVGLLIGGIQYYVHRYD